MQDRGNPQLDVELHAGVLGELGDRLKPPVPILDFGCGDGTMVDAYASRGYDAYGCDISLKEETSRLRLIRKPYRLPFESDTFAFVFSDQVFEHVQDYSLALGEIKRVLRPGGTSLHVFPSRAALVEPHTLVPLAGVLPRRRWLSLWARLGIRNAYQASKPSAEVVALNQRYLGESTNYLTKRQLEAIVGRYFPDFTFVELQLLKHTPGRARHLYPVARRLPLVARLYSACHSRALFLRKETPDRGPRRARRQQFADRPEASSTNASLPRV